MKLIFAQGNPGNAYSKSRHNVGFLVIDALADQLDASWKEKPKMKALVAEVAVNGEKVILAKPTTYYNETGTAARSILDFYKLNADEDFLVIHDDLSLPVGTIRVRQQGSDAGNNGIKSLNNHIGPDYSRVRIGIWNDLRETIDDADFVLGQFNKEESSKLSSDIIPQAIQTVQQFINNTLEYTSHKL